MTIEELIQRQAERRKRKYYAGEALKGIHFRKQIHFIISFILKIDQIISREKIVIIGDKHRAQKNAPTIFACTHIGGNDIQRTFQVIKEPAYLMQGDPGILYKMPIYQGLRLNGVIPLETGDREDRKIAYNRAVELLQKGGNLLIYPEGAWNVTPNQIVMKIFTGTVRLAQETGAEIVPIAVEQYEDTFYFDIGEGYTVPRGSTTSVKEWNDDLRERLATLKWDIMKTQRQARREDIPEGYLKTFQDEIVGRCNYGYGFSLEDAIRESFHDKTITEEKDVFRFMKKLNICKENAFLFRGYSG